MRNFFDEMYVDGSTDVREHYREFGAWLAEQPDDIIARKRAEADLIFRRVGITFAVYGNDVLETVTGAIRRQKVRCRSFILLGNREVRYGLWFDAQLIA
ncbi:MAG: hypothetical protein ACXWIN_09120, partial [Burkholderiaceae bacterium]